MEKSPGVRPIDVEALAATLVGTPTGTLGRADRPLGIGSSPLTPAHSDSTVLVHETLGEGGMGVVRRGVQTVLAREVAIKSARSGRSDELTIAKIVQEALVLGRLEHPNIVPVYTIDRDEARLPRIVMKRVMGDAWSELVADDMAVSARSSGQPLEWHLRVFLQVCHALAYAHSRSIVHLDVKPSNVMLGRFGEVYLLDWGIAFATDDVPDPRIPRLSQCNQIVGTPRYMAPEMLEGDGEQLGVHTDVYLLGATLFELVTKHPPHGGDTVLEVLREIVDVDPQIDVECPPELAELIMRCMARDPAGRPTSALEVARATEQILEHRASSHVADQADAQRRALEQLLDRDGDGAAEDRVHAHFAAARFGYVSALSQWATNAAARTGLALATSRVVRWELARGRPDAAAALLASMPEGTTETRTRADDELGAEVARAMHVVQERAAQLSRLEREHDPRLGQRTRLFLFTLLNAFWVAIPLIAWLVGHDARSEPVGVVPLVALTMLTLMLAMFVWARGSMTATALNRGLAAVLALALGVQLVLGVAAVPLGLDMEQLQVLVLIDYGASAAFAAALIDRRIVWSVVAYAVAVGLVLRFPADRNLALAGANLACWINAATIWRIWRIPLAELRRP